MSRPKRKAPTVVGATAGASNAVGAIAEPLYTLHAATGNNVRSKRYADKVTFEAASGERWGFSGKVGRVLRMLATMPHGVTQWDTLPWHTRLGSSVHTLRESGLAITTQREGDYRHARYFLKTPGSIVAPKGEGATP